MRPMDRHSNRAGLQARACCAVNSLRLYCCAMRPLSILPLCGLLSVSTACAQGPGPLPPKVTGYVTRAASGTDFDANGFRVLCGAKTLTEVEVGPTVDDAANGCPKTSPYIGEIVNVYGSMKKKKHAVVATRIEFRLPVRSSSPGSALIEVLKPPDSTGPQHPGLLVRADGYWIRIGDKTNVSLVPPLQSLADVKPGNWLDYRGARAPDGVVTATAVKIGPNIISQGEEKLRTSKEYDPSKVPADSKPNSAERFFVGVVDPKEFPPYENAAMQARVNAIGEKLIPAFERNLPDSDPAKIHFRFQLIDTTWLRDALTLPSGIILIPRQVVERMQNDSQLATVLADNIACALERQQYRTQTKARLETAAKLGGLAGLAVEGAPALLVGAAASAEVLMPGSDIAAYTMDQSGRVSLGLLHDAGYDIDQAPMAWWLLAKKEPKPIAEVAMPPRAEYLYQILGETWNNPAASNASAVIP